MVTRRQARGVKSGVKDNEGFQPQQSGRGSPRGCGDKGATGEQTENSPGGGAGTTLRRWWEGRREDTGGWVGGGSVILESLECA